MGKNQLIKNTEVIAREKNSHQGSVNSAFKLAGHHLNQAQMQ